MANVKFAGIDEDLTAPNTPWIYYGVSTYPAHHGRSITLTRLSCRAHMLVLVQHT